MLLQNYSDQPSIIVGNYTVFPRKLLGKGSTGSVFRGQHNITNAPVAVKTIELSKVNDEATRSLLENQKMTLRSISGPFVLKLEEIIEEKGFCYIITELCQGTTLSEYLKKQIMLSEKEAMSIFQKLATGCLALTQQCIIHRDLKPANIMIDSRGNPKIIDFGYCEIIMAKKVMKTFNVGSPSYMSPEAYQRTLYSQKSDSWSLGMTLYEMIQGETLDKNMQTAKYFQQLKTGNNLVEKKLSQILSPQVRQTIKSALKYLPDERSSISNLKYQADCYQIKQNQKSLRLSNGYKPATIMQPQPVKERSTEMTSLRNLEVTHIESQNKNHSLKGFVSFQDFTKTTPNFKPSGVMGIQQKTSLEDFDSNSFRHSIDKSKKVAVDSKLDRFIHTVVKKPEVFKPNSSSQLKFQCKPILSARDVDQFHRCQAPPPPPMRRQVTVRYI